METLVKGGELIKSGKPDPAVEVIGVSKCFRLYHDYNVNLKEKLINWRKRGYDLFWALDDINLTIHRGETLGMIGPNGSGKSTLLRMMTRIMKPNKGEIKVHGKIAALLDLGAGFHPDLTGRENIYLNASILGFSKKEVDAIFDEIVEFSELGPFIDNQVKNYSSGMYVRLGFSVAINVDPEILLIDEVLAVGDESFQAKCLERIYSLQRSGKTIVLVTHNSDLAAQISDRVLWLEYGKIRKLGDPWEVVSEYHEAMSIQPKEEESGTQDIFIREVDVLDKAGNPSHSFQTNEPLVVRVHYEAQRPIDHPIFGLSFYDHQGLMVYGTNTQLRGYDISLAEGRGRVDFSIPNLTMLDGRYFISVDIRSRDGETLYHSLDKTRHFDVKSSGRDIGYLSLDCDISWMEE